MRSCAYLFTHPLLKFGVYHLAKLMLTKYMYKYGIDIPFSANIGSGFYIGHFGGIIVNETAVIGINCNISQGVTIGTVSRGEKKDVQFLETMFT